MVPPSACEGEPTCGTRIGDHQPSEVRTPAHHTTDLDTLAMLDALQPLEAEPGAPDGSRFETFVHADRALALELSREIGRA
jgi:hypothetical protein